MDNAFALSICLSVYQSYYYHSFSHRIKALVEDNLSMLAIYK